MYIIRFNTMLHILTFISFCSFTGTGVMAVSYTAKHLLQYTACTSTQRIVANCFQSVVGRGGGGVSHGASSLHYRLMHTNGQWWVWSNKGTLSQVSFFVY